MFDLRPILALIALASGQLLSAVDLPAWEQRVARARLHEERQGSWLERAIPVLDRACHCQGRYDRAAAPSRRPCTQNHTYDCEGFDALHEFFWTMQGGVVLELGAIDGYVGSESLILEHAAGFRRVLIEADPGHRATRRHMAAAATSITAAVCSSANYNQSVHSAYSATAAARTVHFIRQRSVWSGFQGIVEFMAKEHVRRWYPAVERAWVAARRDWAAVDWSALSADKSADIFATEVACASLTDLLDSIGLQWIDFGILDTEGAEISVLRSIDWSRIGFGVLVVEAYSPAGSRPASYAQRVIDAVSELAPGRYRVAHRKRGRNIWFVNTDFAAHAYSVHPPMHPPRAASATRVITRNTRLLPGTRRPRRVETRRI